MAHRNSLSKKILLAAALALSLALARAAHANQGFECTARSGSKRVKIQASTANAVGNPIFSPLLITVNGVETSLHPDHLTGYWNEGDKLFLKAASEDAQEELISLRFHRKDAKISRLTLNYLGTRMINVSVTCKRD